MSLTSPETRRVVALRADAIRIVADSCFSVKLTAAQSVGLAENGSIASACQYLEELVVVREAERREIARRLIDREVELHRPLQADASPRRHVDTEMATLANAEPALRPFMRAAERLYRDQHAKMEAAIKEPVARAAAIMRLDTVYADHIDMAKTHVGTLVIVPSSHSTTSKADRRSDTQPKIDARR